MANTQPTVVTRIIGGLGNQLFQFAYGYYLSQKLNARLIVDTSPYTTWHRRECHLERFKLDLAKFSTDETLPLYAAGRNRYVVAALKRVYTAVGRAGGPITYLRDDKYVSDASPLLGKKWVFLDGYWQHVGYLDSIRNDLIPMFKPKTDVPAGLPATVSEPTVGVHIRRGDYITDPAAAAMQGLLPLDFYPTAYEKLCSDLGHKPIPVLFSDEPEWVKENLKLHPNQLVAEKGSVISDFIQLGSCHHQIIANSTFSWWAAWLNQNPNKKVIAPKRWFAGKKFEIRELIPESWSVL